MKKRGVILVLVILFSFSVYGIIGDFNKDDCVKFDDFLIFADGFRKFTENGTYNETFDLDKDKKIGLGDFLKFAESYNKCEKEIKIGGNKKNKELYKEKQVFLISDKNWQDVLQLVPLTTWTVPEGHPDLKWCNILKNEDGTLRVFNEKDENGNEVVNYVCGYPTLIYHEEETGFDADSIIYFMQQYSADKVIMVGDTPKELDSLLITKPELGAGLKEENIKRILTDNYNNYWDSFNTVVYVEDNYELALMASTYASLINVPFVIKDGVLDKEESLEGRRILCVGDTERDDCSENYNLEELQKKYVELTNTDKIILVNPNDLDIKIEENFKTDKGGNMINKIYGKTSLVSSILAGGKHEIITTTKEKNYEYVNDKIIQDFYYLFQYPYFDPMKCMSNELCAQGLSTEGFNIINAGNPGFNFSFSIDDPLKYSGYMLRDLLVDRKDCWEYMIVNINGVEYRPLNSKDNIYIYFFPHPYLEFSIMHFNIPKEFVNETTLNLNVRMENNGCKLMLNSDKTPYVEVYDKRFYSNYPVKGEMSKIDVLGIKPNSFATFTFRGFDNFNFYKIAELFNHGQLIDNKYEKDYGKCRWTEFDCEGPFVNGEIHFEIYKEDFLDNIIEIKIKSKQDFVKIDGLELYPQIKDYFLTIFASPEAIELTKSSKNSFEGTDLRYQLDGIYSTLERKYNPLNKGRKAQDSRKYRFITGRIFGVSSSDVSAYVTRDLFLDKIKKDKSASFIFRGTSPDQSADDVKGYRGFGNWWNGEENIYKEFSDGVYRCYSYNDLKVGCDSHKERTKQSYLSTYFTLYDNHGWYNWAFIDSFELKNEYLQPKINFISACATCDFALAKKNQNTKELFCMQMLRRGSLGFIGAQSISIQNGNFATGSFVPSLIIKKETLGKAWLKDINEHSYGWNIYYTLIGDPTLKPIYWGEIR